MFTQRLVVTDPVGTNKTASETVLFQEVMPEDITDNNLRTALQKLVAHYIVVVEAKGWQCQVIERPDYEWSKRVEAVDEYGRLRAVRDFAATAAWEE